MPVVRGEYDGYPMFGGIAGPTCLQGTLGVLIHQSGSREADSFTLDNNSSQETARDAKI